MELPRSEIKARCACGQCNVVLHVVLHAHLAQREFHQLGQSIVDCNLHVVQHACKSLQDTASEADMHPSSCCVQFSMSTVCLLQWCIFFHSVQPVCLFEDLRHVTNAYLCTMCKHAPRPNLTNETPDKRIRQQTRIYVQPC